MKFVMLATLAALVSVACAHTAALTARRVHELAQARLSHNMVTLAKVDEEADLDIDINGDDKDEGRNEDLLAERDDLKAQLATKSREFLEQHRKADHLLRQLHIERSKEKVERKELNSVRQALQKLSTEAAAAAAAIGGNSTVASVHKATHAKAAAAAADASGSATLAAHHKQPGPVRSAARHLQLLLEGRGGAVVALEVSRRVHTVSTLKGSRSESKLAKRSGARDASGLDSFQGTSEGEPGALLQQGSTAEMQATDLRRQEAGLQQEIASVQKGGAAEQEKANQKIHDLMLTAAGTVHDLEDQADSVEEDLDKEKESYKQAASEVAKAKDTLLQETMAALNASQHADSLSASLGAAKKALEKSNTRVGMLQQEATVLRGTSDGKDTIQAITAQGTEVHGQVVNLQESLEKAKSQDKASEKENKALRKQVKDLTVQSKQADILADRLKALQIMADANMSSAGDLEATIQRVTELKEHYAGEVEQARNSSEEWHKKADDLNRKLLESEQAAAVTAKDQESTKDQVREARQDADHFFDENSRLQRQSTDLEAKLREAKEAINQSASDSDKLKDEAMKLRDEASQAQTKSQENWKNTQADLAEVKDEVDTANDDKQQTEEELVKTKAVLTNSQKASLGLTSDGGGDLAAQEEEPAAEAAEAAEEKPPEPAQQESAQPVPTQPPQALATMAGDVRQPQHHHREVATSDNSASVASQTSTPKVSLGVASASSHKGAVEVSLGHKDLLGSSLTAALQGGPPPLMPETSHLKLWGASAAAATHRRGLAAAQLAAVAPVAETTIAPQLRGEPRRAKDDGDGGAEAILASVGATPVAPAVRRPAAPAASSRRSTLEKLAEYFASPLGH